MRITRIEPLAVQVNALGDWLFILVHTDEGITGLGEASHSTNDALAIQVLAHYEQTLVGQDPLRIETIRRVLNSRHDGRVAHTVLSAIEQALWDIMGQRLEVPLCTLFGGPLRERLRLYANINRHLQDRSPEGFARAAAKAVAEGFTAVKIAPFDEVRGVNRLRTGPSAAWRAGVERVHAVRQAIGAQIELMVDCHGRFGEAEALAVADALGECDLLWFEEPVPHTMPEALERLTSRVSISTASGESVFGMEGFAPFLTRHLVDVIMPDVKHCGGLAEMKHIAEAARMGSLLVAPHSPSGPVSSAASAQVMSTVANFSILEYAWGEAEWRAALLDPPERIEDGQLVLSQRPGLGHRLNMSVVEEHRIPEVSSRDSSMAMPIGC